MNIEDPLSVRELLGAGDEEAELEAQTAEADELAAAEEWARGYAAKPEKERRREVGALLAEFDRRGSLLAVLMDGLSPWLRDGEPPAPDDDEIRASVERMNDDFTEASNGWALARAERDRLRAFLLEATGTLPFHGFTNDELGDPWVRWVERVAAYLTESHSA